MVCVLRYGRERGWGGMARDREREREIERAEWWDTYREIEREIERES